MPTLTDFAILERSRTCDLVEMVRHYARIAQVDVEQAHRKAGPVDSR